MSKKVLILSGSPRKGGNSDILCDEFLRGAQDAGHKAEKIRVAEKKVAPCSGCYYCSTHGGACVHKDDMADILQKMIDADVIVLASPVYFYSISAQLKAVIDRTVARWLEVKDKEFYYITTMADEESVMLLFLYLPRQTPSPLNSPNSWNFLRNGFLHRNPEAATS